MYKVVDLFAGAGGLSLGFEQTHKYEIKVAFENNPKAQETYRRNHPNVEVLDDVCEADYQKIRGKYGKIDVVIGGPPCQGFSNANRQKNHAISQNNMLVKQFIRAIIELQPDGFVMENVSMLKSDVHRFYLERRDVKTINEYEIPTVPAQIFLLDAKYKFDGAVEIIQSSDLIRQYMWDPDIYSVVNVIYKQNRNGAKLLKALNKYQKKLLQLRNKVMVEGNELIYLMNADICKAFEGYYMGICGADTVIAAIERPVMIQRMLSRAKEILDNDIKIERYNSESDIVAETKSFAVFDFITGILSSKKQGYVIDSGVLCAADFGAPQKRMRFVVMGVKKSVNPKIALPNGHIEADEYLTVHDAIADLEDVAPVVELNDDIGQKLGEPPQNISPLGRKLRNSDILYNHIVTQSSNIALERFAAIRQGQNFHSLSNEMKENTYTDASRTQNTIYLRLDYNEPSGTVVNVRKSMWIHPVHDRAISVREAARLQTFPDSFVFTGTKDSQYQQVGNAVPPILAKAIAKKMYRVLRQETHRKKYYG